MDEENNKVIDFSGRAFERGWEKLGEQQYELLCAIAELIKAVANAHVGEDHEALRGAAKILLAYVKADADEEQRFNFVVAMQKIERLGDT